MRSRANKNRLRFDRDLWCSLKECLDLKLVHPATQTVSESSLEPKVKIASAHVWTGIGAIGTALIGMMLFRESAHWLRLVSIAVVLLGIAGLRLSWRQ